jgi:hypothetical protein
LHEAGSPAEFFLLAPESLGADAVENVDDTLRRRVAHVGVSDLRAEAPPILFRGGGVRAEEGGPQVAFEPSRGLPALRFRAPFRGLGGLLAQALFLLLLESQFALVGLPNLGKVLLKFWVG